MFYHRENISLSDLFSPVHSSYVWSFSISNNHEMFMNFLISPSCFFIKEI